MSDDQMINKEFHILQRHKLLKDKDRFIYSEICSRIKLSIENINFSIKNCLEIVNSSKKIYEYFQSRFPKVNYFIMDIAKKILENKPHTHQSILLDHDKWNLEQIKFYLIISNLYLHLTNNFDLLLKNINNSLNNNGFFIATLPSNNCFYEIRNCMIQADIEIYGGL